MKTVTMSFMNTSKESLADGVITPKVSVEASCALFLVK